MSSKNIPDCLTAIPPITFETLPQEIRDHIYKLISPPEQYICVSSLEEYQCGTFDITTGQPGDALLDANYSTANIALEATTSCIIRGWIIVCPVSYQPKGIP